MYEEKERKTKMIRLKKMMALAIAMVMVICTMNFTVFAEPSQPNPPQADTTITITELDAGDTVNLYKVLEWKDGEGWRLTADFASLSDNATIKKFTNPEKGQAVVEMDKETLDAIATAAKNANPVNPTGNKVAEGATSYTYTTYSATDPVVDRPGMYVALIEPAVAGVVYNPIVVSADYESKNATNTISSSAEIRTSEGAAVVKAIAKKKKITVEKTEPKITNDINETYTFTINTTIPVYADSYTSTYFTVKDNVGQYLKLVGGTLKVMAGSKDITSTATTNTFAADAQEFTLGWDHDYIKGLAAAQDITITYDAKLAVTKEEAAELPNVQEEYNRVTIEFPNNPKDDTGKGAIKDETREYTFTIDGNLFGKEDWQTAEIVKVGVDNAGNPIESMVDYKNGSSFAALDGAEFGLYTDPECKTLYTNKAFEGKVTTANGGLMTIPGLDVGTYYLKELTAPKGYIKDGDAHKIEITAKFKDTEVTEYFDGKEWSLVQKNKGDIAYTYTVKTLESYTVTVDGNKSTYNMTLSGPSISSVTPGDSSTAIANTKGVELPATGGIGTTIFYVIGTILVLGAGILLVTRRRMNMD